MMKAAKDDIDYQTIIQALGKIKNPKYLPLNHPGWQLNSVWSQLSVDSTLGLIILNGNRIFVPKSERKGLLNDIVAQEKQLGEPKSYTSGGAWPQMLTC